jgi:serine protease Do
LIFSIDIHSFDFPFDYIAAMAGIKTGAIILQINRVQMKSATDFNRSTKDSRSNKRLVVTG